MKVIELDEEMTERKQAEEALRESEARYRRLFENATLGIFQSTLSGQVITVNATFARMFGYAAPEEVRAMVKDVGVDIFADPGRRAEIARLRLADPTLTSFENLYRRKDGSTFTGQLNVQPLTDANGQVTGFEGLIEDISARKQAEQLVQQQNELLQAQNEELTAQREELQSQNEELRAQQEELQQTEAELRRSEANLNKAQHVAKAGSWTWHIQADRLEWSDEMFSIFGLAQESFTGNLAEVMAHAIHPDDRADVERANLSVMHDKQPVPLEYRVVRPDGTVRVVWAGAGELTLDDAGRPLTLTGIVQDITARKQAEVALRASEAKLRAILDATPFPIALVDVQDNTIDFWSRSALTLFGHTAPTAAEWYQLAYPDPDYQREVIERWKPSLEKARLSGQAVNTGEYRVTCRDGSVRICELYAAFLADSLIVTFNDITDRKQAEAQVAASQKLLQDITDASTSPIYALDSDGRFLLINRRLESLLGVPRETLLGHTREAVLPSEIAAAHRANDLRVIAERKPITFEEENYEPDGKHTYLSAKFPLLDLQGEAYGLGGLSTDITERKRAELLIRAQQEQLVAQNEELAAQNEELATQARALEAAEAKLRQVNSELEQRIQARSAELRAANADLQLANAALLRAGRMKDEFLANMSHELRTPLTGILGLTEVMDKGIYGDLSEKQRHALQLMQAGGEHLLQLINDILDLSKVEAGKVELQIAPVLVEDICQASLEFVKQTAHKKNLKLNFTPDAQVSLVQADSRRFKQMLVNLLSNAVKFTSEGGQVGLEVAGDPARQQARFTIWDTGIGIAPEKHALLFRPFVQLDGSLARPYEGAGLGLALVHSMAELHGGSVTVESAGLGQGARFTITLPWTPPDEVRSAEPLSPAPANAGESASVPLATLLGRPPVILAADDNLVTLMVFTSFLEAMGCQVATAQNGMQALEQAQTVQPDLMLLDIQMPDLDGLAVIRGLRATAPGAAMPIIALTALAMPGDRERCLAAGADDYLSKPVNLNALALAIARHLEAKKTKP